MWNSNSKVIFALIDLGADIADNNKGENLTILLKLMKDSNLQMDIGM